MFAERAAGLILALVCSIVPVFAQDDRPRTVPVDNNLQRTLIDQSGKQAKSRAPAAAVRPDLPSIDLQSRLKDVQITTTPAGDIVTVETDQGPIQLSATEYMRSLALTKAAVEHGGFFYKFFNISKPWGFLWISIGFLGQAMFTFRMVLQWWASEKHKRSVVPVGFWWGSLIGGAMLFAYFVWRKDVVGIVGQSTGVFVYARNLVLIYRGQRIESEGARPLEKGEPGPAAT
jgi:lipid-A-disaccharide synthase-like uncharacterized protein